MTSRLSPTPASIMEAFILSHSDPVASRAFRSATARDLSRALSETREASLLTTCLLVEIGRFVKLDDAWRTDVSAVILGQLVAGTHSTVAERRTLRKSPVDGAWWARNARAKTEPVVFEFGTGRDDFFDIDLTDPCLGPRVTACAWWPLDATHYEPMLLIGCLHPRGLNLTLRVLGSSAVLTGGEEHGGMATAIWSVIRWITCRVLVTTGRNPIEVLGLALHRAVARCENHNFLPTPVMAGLNLDVKELHTD